MPESGHTTGGRVVLSPPLRVWCWRDLREGNRRAGAFEGGLRLFGLFLVDLLQDRLRSAFHEFLGLLEAKTGESTDLLDDGDLVSAIGFEDDVELVLLVAARAPASPPPAAGPQAATATGAAAVTSKVSSKAFTNSLSSSRDISLNASNISSVLIFAMVASFRSFRPRAGWASALGCLLRLGGRLSVGLRCVGGR